MTLRLPTLADLGWAQFYASQLDGDDLDRYAPVRVMAVHRGQLSVAGDGLDRHAPAFIPDALSEEDHPTVGDWLLLDRETFLPERVLRRASLFKRRAPGADHRLQLIAANLDTLFIVSSCNQDFNIARLERYLILAREAGVVPVIVLTKEDLTDKPGDYAKEARGLLPGVLVETVNTLDPDSVACLSLWCGPGQTVALLGSSGVGKSTLVNTLTGADEIATQSVREDDAKGRHTTTGRAMHRLPQGGWLIDTPGMRELQLTDIACGLEEVFSDIADLTRECRFSDCRHEREPGCAVQSALEEGVLDQARLKRWRKLLNEEARNTESLVERRARGRAFSKMAKDAIRRKK